MKLSLTLATATFALLSAAATAQAAEPAASGAKMPRVERREAKQEARIDQGIASGALTGRETKALDAQQGRIDRVENRAKADGVVTKGEREHITHLQNKANRDIKVQKHDRQTAASAAK